MSKFLDGTGLSDLITKIKNAFVAKADTTAVTSVAVDTAPTANSTNLVTSGGVYANCAQSLTASSKKIWAGSAADYAQLTPSNDTIYFITP